jgi:hypothetical protein
MTDRSTFDPFEQRIAGGLERFVAPAVDPKSAAEIAEVAMRPRGPVIRARNTSRPRRLLLLGFAAALLVPAAYIGASTFRPPTEDRVTQLQPSRTDGPRPTAASSAPAPSARVSSGDVSIFTRRDEGPEPGVAIFAVRTDGTEALIRKVPDSILNGHGRLSDWDTVSGAGWLAMGVDLFGGPWPMILIDLTDAQAQPWVIDEADLGGMGPRWGPTGLVAASIGGNGAYGVIIADPETHTTNRMSLQGYGLVGGGPSIVWTADGRGIVGSSGDVVFATIPLDRGAPVVGVGQTFDPDYGPGMATLRICSPDETCRGGADGRIERVEPDGSTQTIWQQQGDDRVLAAVFGRGADEYWLTMDHDNGRQVTLVQLHDGRQDTVTTLNRDALWGDVGAPLEAPDHSTLALRISSIGATLVPLSGAPSTYHPGHFAGYVDGVTSAAFSPGQSGMPAQTMPAAGLPYAVPSLDELIAAELSLNPGRTVLGKASHDAVDGTSAKRTVEVPRDGTGTADVYLDCLGPSSVTVRSGQSSTTSPCLRAGAYVFSVEGSDPILVTATDDTTWRVVVYSGP